LEFVVAVGQEGIFGDVMSQQSKQGVAQKDEASRIEGVVGDEDEPGDKGRASHSTAKIYLTIWCIACTAKKQIMVKAKFVPNTI